MYVFPRQLCSYCLLCVLVSFTLFIVPRPDNAVLLERPLWRQNVRPNANALDPLKGKYGFDGGVLPGGVDTAPPEWKESYPRLDPVWEGGPHLELAAQTMEPAVVYWALAVPWSRPPTSREVYDAVVRPNHTKTPAAGDGAPTGTTVDLRAQAPPRAQPPPSATAPTRSPRPTRRSHPAGRGVRVDPKGAQRAAAPEDPSGPEVAHAPTPKQQHPPL